MAADLRAGLLALALTLASGGASLVFDQPVSVTGRALAARAGQTAAQRLQSPGPGALTTGIAAAPGIAQDSDLAALADAAFTSPAAAGRKIWAAIKGDPAELEGRVRPLPALASPPPAGAGPAVIIAEPLPDPGIPGFHFPESEATVTGWVSAQSHGAAPAIAAAGAETLQAHAWGLWTALTLPTAQTYAQEPLRVFETWITPDEIAVQPARQTVAGMVRQPRHRAALQEFERFQNARAGFVALGSRDPADAARVVGVVKLDPSAAEHVLSQQLFSAAALTRLLAGGAAQIPPFPASAVAVKVVYKVIRPADVVAGRYYRLPAWSGPPAVAQPWGPARWPACVWVDLQDGGAGQGLTDGVGAADGSSRTAATTYPLADFLALHLTADEAAVLNAAVPSTGAAAGDPALLVAMHVSGREIARWTWQTFWWTPDPDHPPAPSSPAFAAGRPAQLHGAPRHYAMALAYNLLNPDPPYVGGENTGAAVYAYNPWLEAQFAPSDLPDSQPGTGPEGRPAANNCGVQSNCMSCHLRANFNPRSLPTAPRYAGAGYDDLTDPRFVGTLQTDFLWSVALEAQ